MSERIRLVLMPLYKNYRALCHCTIRNERDRALEIGTNGRKGRAVGIGTDGQTVFVEVDFEDLGALDVETEVRYQESTLPAQITITEYWDNDPPRTHTYDILVGLELVEVGTPVLESVP